MSDDELWWDEQERQAWKADHEMCHSTADRQPATCGVAMSGGGHCVLQKGHNGRCRGYWHDRAFRAEIRVAALEPIVAHIAGLVVQDADGYSQVHRVLVEEARSALGGTSSEELAA